MISKLAIKQGLNKKIFEPLLHSRMRKKYADSPISFISSNCMGGVLSHDLGMQFCSPTVNLWMSASDYIKLIENMDYYFSQTFENGNQGEDYPIGRLGDLKLHCIHYHTFEEAKEKWDARTMRINKNRIILTFTDQNNCNKELLERFSNVDYPKIFLTSNAEYAKYDFSVYMNSVKYMEKHNGRTLVDDAFIFRGFSGKRNFEHYFNIDQFLINNHF